MHRILRWGGLAAAVGLVTAMSIDSDEAGGTKTFTETGQEYVVTSLSKDALLQPLFVEARALHGPASVVWCGVVHQFSECNVGGRGNSVAFEQVHAVPTSGQFPKGRIIYAMKYEVVANGDKFVMAGSFIPQTDGSFVSHLELLPQQGTGRFAGATGLIDVVKPIPGGYVFEGKITTVGAGAD